MTDCSNDSQSFEQSASHPDHQHEHDHPIHHDKKHPDHHEPEPDDEKGEDEGGIVHPANDSEPGNLPDPPPGH